MSALESANQLVAEFSGLVSPPIEFREEISVSLSDAQQIGTVLDFAKKHLGFDYLVDITSIDNYGEDPRFQIVYHLYNYQRRYHLRLKTAISEELCALPTITSIWKTANWHEREIYDMMGIRFIGHPDLRRILMWEGYPHFPLRKDFPLAGRETDVPEVAFSQAAPLEGGPFVTVAGGKDTISREPRVRLPNEDHLTTNARLERRRDLNRTAEQQPDPQKQ